MNFSIDCVNKNKEVIGSQNVSVSNEKIDDHKISFLTNDGTTAFTIDTDAGELIFDNSEGDFDEITLDKPIAKIKINNVKMDYNQNLTFNMEGSKTSYRINGTAFEKKTGNSFDTLKTFEAPLNIMLPSTMFEDVEKNNLEVNGLPFQMFSALKDEDVASMGIETYESKNKLLHLVKYNDNVFVGRGNKLIPVNLEKQNLYKMGNESVLGFTVGRGNGISGKQSSGIAFRMSEKELEDVATFLNGTLENVTFKTEEDYKNNDIDYARVNQQSDLSKTINDAEVVADGETVAPGIATNVNQTSNETTTPPPPPPQTPEQKQTEEEKAKEPPAKEPEVKQEKAKEPAPIETLKISAGGFGIIAALLAALMISGVFVTWLAFALFGICALASTASSVGTLNYRKHSKRTKKDKIQDKIAKKERKLAILNAKEPTPAREARKTALAKAIQNEEQKLQKIINKENGIKTEKTKREKIQPTEVVEKAEEQLEQEQEQNPTQLLPGAELKPEPLSPEVAKMLNETQNTANEQENTNTEVLDNAVYLSPTQSNMLLANESILKGIDDVQKAATIEERDAELKNLDEKLKVVCPDGFHPNSAEDENVKQYLQSILDIRIALAAYAGSKETHLVDENNQKIFTDSDIEEQDRLRNAVMEQLEITKDSCLAYPDIIQQNEEQKLQQKQSQEDDKEMTR